MSSYSEGQTHQVMESLEANGFTPDHVTKFGQHPQLGDIRRWLDGELVLADPASVTLDTIIRVDRSVRPAYPDWVDKVLNRDLECTGPVEYDLATQTSIWLHEDQQGSRRTTGNAIYGHLKEHNMLESCASLQDALAIQNMGDAVFRRVFGDRIPYFWKSVVRHRGGGDLSVPCLGVGGGQVVLGWRWLLRDWSGHGPALRFASS